MRQIRWREPIIVYALVLGGIVFRLWFIALAPQPFGWDQYEYEMYAKKIYEHPRMLASHSYRSYPYPLLLAGLYKIVGFGNHEAVFWLQAVMDAVTGALIFWTILRGFKNRSAAWLGFVLYEINPFTSGYVGVLLAEVSTAFFLAASLAAGVEFVRKPTMGKGLVLGVFVGLTAETRNAAFAWAAVPVVLAFMRIRSIRTNPTNAPIIEAMRGMMKSLNHYVIDWSDWVIGQIGRISLFVSILIGIILTLLYPLFVNWRDYHEINATTVDSFYAKEFFQGALLKRLPPFTYLYPPESHIMWSEYYSEYDPGRTTQARRAMAQKYYDKGWARINQDPWDYLRVRFEKMWYVWQKENIFFYQEPGFAEHRHITYAVNMLLLILAAAGLLVASTLKNYAPSRWLWWTILGSLVYATVAFSFSHAEYRLTIPFYPMLFVVAPFGIVWLWENGVHHTG